MITRIKSLFIGLALFTSLAQTVRAAVTFSVTPAAVSNTYTGTITLQIGGLTNTETVVVQKFLDLNTNGVIDGGDWLVQQFNLTDGHAGMVIGGVTNFNVPGDTDGTPNGQITTTLNFQNGDCAQNIVGNYFYVLSSPVGHFSSVTNSFGVTNFPFAQMFTGNVVSNGSSATVPNAVVLLLPPSGAPVAAAAVANNAGSYTVLVPPGTYTLVAYGSNYVASSSPVLTLGIGQTLTANLTVTHATSSISGKLVETNNSTGLPGVNLLAQAGNSLTVAFTDTNGNFTVPVTAGTWAINASTDALLVHGCLKSNGIYVNSGTTGATLAVPQATALIYGNVQDNFGNPLPFLEVFTDDTFNQYKTEGFTDTNGNYVLGVIGWTGLIPIDYWNVYANDDNQLTNYVFSQETLTSYINAGQAVLQNFTATLMPPQVTTSALSNGTNDVAYSNSLSASYGQAPYSWSLVAGSLPSGLTLTTNGWISGTPTTNGIFTFTVQVTDALSETATQALSLTVGLCVATTSLFPGIEGESFGQYVIPAPDGHGPYSWSLVAGSLPSGLTLGPRGFIYGTPTTNGTFNFTVQVADAFSVTATQALTLVVFGPPNVTIIQPANNSVATTVGNNVTLAVSVAGFGPYSYQWQLNGTNLLNGTITTVMGGDADGLAMDATGNLLIVNQNAHRIFKVDTNGIITTVAGNGTDGFSGDGGAATNAELSDPEDVAVDKTGNLFIADMGNERIRKVGTNGIITTVAGNGTNGFSGDGGAATNAEFYRPYGIAVDNIGNLFIADLENSRIRKVDTNGIITTIAGGGTNYPGDGGLATNAAIGAGKVAVDATGNLFIAGSTTYKVETNGIITTVAGGGTNYPGDGGAATNAELGGIEGIAVDANGNIFIADVGNNVICEVGTNGIIMTVAGNGTPGYTGDGGAATSAELNYPMGLAVDVNGNLFIGDVGNNVIRELFDPGFIIGPTLTLNNVGLGNAGEYDVVVSNPYGSVTSSVVNITVTLPPVILSTPKITGDNNKFTFQLSGPAGSNYVLQISTNMLIWNQISTSTIPVSGILTLTNSISGYNQGYFRVNLQ